MAAVQALGAAIFCRLDSAFPSLQRLPMFEPSLPDHDDDAWELAFVGDDKAEVTAIEARGGMVVASGPEIGVLRPGGATWHGHAPPPYVGEPARLVAVEPAGRRRYAIASGDTFTLFTRWEASEQVAGMSSTMPGAKVTHMAWVKRQGQSLLFVLRDDLVLRRMKARPSSLEDEELDPVYALGSDERGAYAFVALSGERQRVYSVPDGGRWRIRYLDTRISRRASLQLAVAENAVALVVDAKYVLLSRALGEPFVRVPSLDLGENEHGFRLGPVAFQGATSDAALFCARKEDDLVRIVRVDAAGAPMSILELAGTDLRAAPDILSLSWDGSRQTLWGTTSNAGIFRLMPPEAKGKNRVVLS
jgi:hypothetical protein